MLARPAVRCDHHLVSLDTKMRFSFILSCLACALIHGISAQVGAAGSTETIPQVPVLMLTSTRSPVIHRRRPMKPNANIQYHPYAHVAMSTPQQQSTSSSMTSVTNSTITTSQLPENGTTASIATPVTSSTQEFMTTPEPVLTSQMTTLATNLQADSMSHTTESQETTTTPESTGSMNPAISKLARLRRPLQHRHTTTVPVSEVTTVVNATDVPITTPPPYWRPVQQVRTRPTTIEMQDTSPVTVATTPDLTSLAPTSAPNATDSSISSNSDEATTISADPSTTPAAVTLPIAALLQPKDSISVTSSPSTLKAVAEETGNSTIASTTSAPTIAPMIIEASTEILPTSAPVDQTADMNLTTSSILATSSNESTVPSISLTPPALNANTVPSVTVSSVRNSSDVQSATAATVTSAVPAGTAVPGHVLVPSTETPQYSTTPPAASTISGPSGPVAISQTESSSLPVAPSTSVPPVMHDPTTLTGPVLPTFPTSSLSRPPFPGPIRPPPGHVPGASSMPQLPSSPNAPSPTESPNVPVAPPIRLPGVVQPASDSFNGPHTMTEPVLPAFPTSSLSRPALPGPIRPPSVNVPGGSSMPQLPSSPNAPSHAAPPNLPVAPSTSVPPVMHDPTTLTGPVLPTFPSGSPSPPVLPGRIRPISANVPGASLMTQPSSDPNGAPLPSDRPVNEAPIPFQIPVAPTPSISMPNPTNLNTEPVQASAPNQFRSPAGIPVAPLTTVPQTGFWIPIAVPPPLADPSPLPTFSPRRFRRGLPSSVVMMPITQAMQPSDNSWVPISGPAVTTVPNPPPPPPAPAAIDTPVNQQMIPGPAMPSSGSFPITAAPVNLQAVPEAVMSASVPFAQPATAPVVQPKPVPVTRQSPPLAPNNKPLTVAPAPVGITPPAGPANRPPFAFAQAPAGVPVNLPVTSNPEPVTTAPIQPPTPYPPTLAPTIPANPPPSIVSQVLTQTGTSMLVPVHTLNLGTPHVPAAPPAIPPTGGPGDKSLPPAK